MHIFPEGIFLGNTRNPFRIRLTGWSRRKEKCRTLPTLVPDACVPDAGYGSYALVWEIATRKMGNMLTEDVLIQMVPFTLTIFLVRIY
ncbi:hypothetical protein CEXT_635011 [Caerostris extrusa]|uniref:Uncharacterized protein n=1 Tax=Caerostris extrusa TaxID=172846 RepID=A0AAV4W351_CAEEX|nr:hypothetical protein CEXT_635011 [Caerostris extrusa]